MKITPIEIRQHTFQRGLRGYDVEEVGAFLTSLSNEWERVLNENKMLKMQLEIAEKDLNKLREVELTMFRMFKTAEDTSTQMTEQAKVAAEQYIEEARLKGEELINEARKKSNMLVIDAENQAKYVREEIIGEFKGHERDFKAMEKYRDNLVVQLKTLANNTFDSIERFEKKFSQNTIKEKLDGLKTQIDDALQIAEDSHQARLEAEKLTEEAQKVTATPEEDIQTSENNLVAVTPVTEIKLHEDSVDKDAEDEIDDEETHKENEKKESEEGSFFDQI
ncbi:MAG: DivIVA domain-containing protein [Spirosomataceae bacterium]